MKRLAMAVTLALSLVLGAGGAPGQEAREAPKKPKKKPPPKRKTVLRGAHAQMAKLCDLSEEQQQKIVELNAERGKALAAFRKENAEQIKAAEANRKKARESKDKDAIKKAGEEMAAIRAKQNEIIKKSQADVMAVLTPEQKDKWDTHNLMRTVKRWFRDFQFTDEQTDQVKAAYKKLAGDADMDDRKARDKVYRTLTEEVRYKILTPEQQATQAVGYIAGRFRGIKFTDEQTAQIKTAHVKLAGAVDVTDRKARDKVFRDLDAQIRKEILTEEQRTTLAVASVVGRYRTAKLTDEQTGEVRAAYVKLAAGADMNDRKARDKAFRDLHAKVRKEILTEEQRTTLAVLSVTGRYYRAKLTNDQKAQVRAAYVKATTDVDMSDRKAAEAARKKLHEEIQSQVLTDQQREAMKPKPRPKKSE